MSSVNPGSSARAQGGASRGQKETKLEDQLETGPGRGHDDRSWRTQTGIQIQSLPPSSMCPMTPPLASSGEDYFITDIVATYHCMTIVKSRPIVVGLFLNSPQTMQVLEPGLREDGSQPLPLVCYYLPPSFFPAVPSSPHPTATSPGEERGQLA